MLGNVQLEHFTLYYEVGIDTYILCCYIFIGLGNLSNYFTS